MPFHIEKKDVIYLSNKHTFFKTLFNTCKKVEIDYLTPYQALVKAILIQENEDLDHFPLFVNTSYYKLINDSNWNDHYQFHQKTVFILNEVATLLKDKVIDFDELSLLDCKIIIELLSQIQGLSTKAIQFFMLYGLNKKECFIDDLSIIHLLEEYDVDITQYKGYESLIYIYSKAFFRLDRKGILVNTSIGEITIVSEMCQIVDITFDQTLVYQHESTSLLENAAQQIKEFIDGNRKHFDLPIQLSGTPFSKKVLQVIHDIPYGEVLTYQEVAVLAGFPKAMRAVGSVCHKNRILFVIPCHRVIAANKKIGGFAYGTQTKAVLLDHEAQSKGCW
ncbi:MAG: methylated-DNA--[protein]-cysteine S-methyltransferase [Erysipelotrichaceae bacterium]